MQVEDLMSHPAVICHVNDPLSVAAHLMWEHDCGALPVVRDDGKLAGMITDRDICMAAYTQGRRLDEILVNAVMSKTVASAREDQTIDQIQQMMAEYQVHRLPVVDPDHKPVGVVSVNDLATECAQPDTMMPHGPAKLVRTIAAICQPRRAARQQRRRAKEAAARAVAAAAAEPILR